MIFKKKDLLVDTMPKLQFIKMFKGQLIVMMLNSLSRIKMQFKLKSNV